MIAAPSRLRMMTYNVMLLNDDVDDPQTRDEMFGPTPLGRYRDVAEVIQAGQADVVALQEVENPESLQQLLDLRGLGEQYPFRVFQPSNDDKGLHLALLSRYPISGAKSHKDRVIGGTLQEPERFRRDLLQADVTLPNGEKTRLFVTHYISKFKKNRWSEEYRLREAEATRAILEEQSREYPVRYEVVLGDLNDTDDSPALAELTDPDEELRLHDVGRGLPYTWGHRLFVKPRKGLKPSRIDHILCNTAMLHSLRLRELIRHPRELMASDHLATCAEFYLTAQ